MLPRVFLLLPLAVMLTAPASAQFGLPEMPCHEGTAREVLRGAEVSATLFPNGNLFFGNQTTSGDGYLVPVSADTPFPSTGLFAGGLWLGGQVEDEVRAPAATYANFAFRPGLTGKDGTPPTPAECAAADRIWVVSRDDIARYLAGEPPEADLAEWPVQLGAPVLDGDGVAGNYDLAAGDQPAIRGDVMAFWAMTDTATRRVGDPLPLGVDVAVEAFTFREASLGMHTWLRYTITNRNAVPIDSAYVGLWFEPRVGDTVSGAFLGTDTTYQMGYGYGAFSPTSGPPPAALGGLLLEGPATSSDDDRRLELTATSFVVSGGRPEVTDPGQPLHYYHRLQGLWNDGSEMRAHNYGYNEPATYPTTTYAYPGDPVTESFWSEVNTDGSGTNNPLGQRRMSFSSGPFQLFPDSSTTASFAFLFAQGTDRFNSVRVLRSQARGVLAAQAAGGFEPERIGGVPPPVPLAVSRPRPNPFTDATTVEVRGATPEARLSVAVYDVLGRLVRAPEAVEGSRRSVELGRGLASGVYVVRVEGTGFAETFPIVKVK